MATPEKPKRIQKLCTLWTHEPAFSTEEVVFNIDRFPELKLENGSLAQIIPLIQGTSVRDFVHDAPKLEHLRGSRRDGRHNGSSSRRNRSNSAAPVTLDETGSFIMAEKDTDEQRSYVFVANDATSDMKQRHPHLQISIASSIAAVFGFRNRMTVLVATADEEDNSASHVELTFRDEYLSRGDMWRLVVSELSSKTVYKDQKLLFLGTVKASVKNVYIDGQKKKSGYFSATTKPIFRSESARYTLFIQMSKEMWDFDSEGAGEIMFNKVINGFLPELFKNWMSINAHHLVSIILFTRLEYREEQDQQNMTTHLGHRTYANRDGYRDFYKVVVSEMASNDWIKILYQLKKEFRSFLRDISVEPQHSDTDKELKYAIAGRPCRASKGNILEAINLASAQFSRDYIDRDLVRTGISVVVITAGTGIYEVDYDMLKLTTDVLMGSGIGIDLVCLSPMPLHSVPLFMYRNPRVLESTLPTAVPSPSQSMPDGTPRQHELNMRKLHSKRDKLSELVAGEWSYAIPHWVDVSFWNGTADEQAMLLKHRKRRRRANKIGHMDQHFSIRCRLYELQMMGLMENEMTNISVDKLHEHPLHPWHRMRHQITGRPITKETESRVGEYEREWMNDYDDYIFRPLKERQAAEEAARKRSQKSALDNSRLTKESSEHSSAYSEGIEAQGSSFRPGKGFLDWKLQEKAPVTPPTLGRRPSVTSLMSNATTDTAVSKTSYFKMSRQFSSGGSPFGPTKAVVSMHVSPAYKPSTFGKESEAESSKAPNISTITQQFKAALTRSSSQNLTPTLKSLNENSKEKSRPINIGRVATQAEHDATGAVSGSADTLRGREVLRVTEKTGKPGQSERESEATTNLFKTSTLRKYAPQLSSSADEPIPQTLPLNRALAPWLVLVNPCNPRKNDLDTNSQFRRWQHVFPRQRKTGSIKWKSLCSPASVPLTNDFFPTAKQLAAEYHESPYHINQDDDDEMSEAPQSRESLIRELIAFRLSHGFQLIVGDSVEEFLGKKSSDLAHIFDKNYMAKDGATIFMSVGSTIHQLLCGSDGKVEIRRFTRKPAEEYESLETTNAVIYRPYIRTALASEYEQREMALRLPKSDFNWNIIDTFIAGHHDEFSDILRFWRARFVLLPVDIPSHSRNGPGQRRQGLAMVTEDTEEEVRLEGIRKLTQVWQRNRVLPPEERIHQMKRRKDPNPLAIEYQTRDPSAIIASGADSSVFADSDPAVPTTANETHNSKHIDIPKLAEELQGEKGIKMMDRRWHWRLHYNCFVGSDLTSWILLNFEDIQTREEAVTLGITLMEKGLFLHVQSKHQFRDGNFFFQIAPTYRAPRPESRMGWMGFTARRGIGSVPATPMTETPRGASMAGKRPESRSSTGSSIDQSGEKTPTTIPERRKVNLSNVMRYDVDPRNKSYRPEIINLHYDRLHNPDNCYHIRIDWMNVTAKFIEDSVVYWAQSVERYGLKLVELPIAEACAIVDDHPFRSPYLIKLALPPPPAPVLQSYDATSFSAVLKSDKHAYHKALLKKHHFVLDIEAASSFPSDVDVMYSWGKPDYKYTQYIHKSGVVLAQITDEGDFLLLANRLYNDRATGRREAARIDTKERQHDRRNVGGMAPFHGGSSRGRSSPMSSPLIRALPEPTPLKKTAEDIKDEFEAFCKNATRLKRFYMEEIKYRGSPSPQSTPVQDASVPELMLPPKISARGISPLPPLGK